MPATVLTAAVLIGFFGAIGGLGSVAYGAFRFGDGGGPLILVGLGVFLGAAVWVFGLANKYRAAQIAAGVVGLFGMLAAATQLGQGNLTNVAWAAIAVAVGGLAVIPMSARQWFSQAEVSLSRRSAAIAVAAAVAAVGATAYVFMTGTLQWTDPAGAKACTMLRDGINDGGKINLLKLSADIGDIGKDATTPSIRASVHLLPDWGPDTDALAMLDELHAACVESGVPMPAYPRTYPIT